MSVRHTHMHCTITYCKSWSFVRILICHTWALLNFDWLRPACPRPAGLIDMLFRYQRCYRKKIKCRFKGMHHVIFVHCWSFYIKSIILFDILLVITWLRTCRASLYPAWLIYCRFIVLPFSTLIVLYRQISLSYEPHNKGCSPLNFSFKSFFSHFVSWMLDCLFRLSAQEESALWRLKDKKNNKAAANGSGIFEVRTDLCDSVRSAWINWQLAGKGVTILVTVLLRVR